MKLPNAEQALIEPEKVRDYLLSASHPVGRFKSAYLQALGYSQDEWEFLRDELLALAKSDAASPGRPIEYGRKFEVRGTLRGRGGRPAGIVAVWVVRHGEDFPRFVTAYPE